MKKNELKILLIPLLYLVFLTLFYFFGKYIDLKGIIFFMLGSLLGATLMLIDEKVLATRYNNPDQIYLATRSTIFIMALIPLSLFIVTSSGSLIGLGIILTVCSGIFFEMFEFRRDIKKFHNRFLLQINKVYDQRAVNSTVVFAGVFLIIIHLLALR